MTTSLPRKASHDGNDDDDVNLMIKIHDNDDEEDQPVHPFEVFIVVAIVMTNAKIMIKMRMIMRQT